MTIRSKNWVLVLLIPCWGILVGGGMLLLKRYENSPSPTGSAPAQWPKDTALTLANGARTLLLFVHPHCPCTNATISELERLAASLGDRLVTYVIFLHPSGMPADWHQTRLWTRVKAIPGVHVIDDFCCELTRQFRVTTSGEAYLYSASGQLLFAGGITLARGHSGDNPGSDTILSMASALADPFDEMPRFCSVFGCPLFESTDTDSTSKGQQP